MPTKTKKPAKRIKKLAPATELAEPSEVRFIHIPRVAGIRVDHDTALQFSAVYACVRLISQTIASMAWHALRRRPGGNGNDLMPDHVVDWILHRQANPEISAFTFRETMLAWALTWGNGYAEIERDGAGRPAWLWLLSPDRVTVSRDDSGRLVYEVYNYGQESTVLFAENVFHLKGLGYDGLTGYSVISMAAKSIGMGMATEEFGSAFFGNGSRPGGVLQYPGRLKKEARLNLRESWERLHGGPANSGRVAILEEGVTWQTIGIPPEDAQFLESRQFQVTEIARWFGVPPHMIADLTKSSYSNIEQQAIEVVNYCFGPWVKRLETEADIKLFGRTNRGVMFTKLNMDSLLRGDTAARTQHYKDLFDRGVYSVNDILELEDRNPIGPDGDKRFVPINFTTLEKAGEEPLAPKPLPFGESDAEPDEEKPDDDAQEEDGLSKIKAALSPVFQEALGRIIRRENNEAKKHGVNGDLAAREKWLEGFAPSHRKYIGDTLASPVLALAKIHLMADELLPPAKAALETLIDLYTEGHMGWLRSNQHYDADVPEVATGLIHKTILAVQLSRKP